MGEIVAEWIEFAKNDLESAEYLTGRHPQPLEIICFECQQCAEKILKAFLLKNDIEPPRTHDLNRLCEMCGEIDDKFDNFAGYCGSLNKYGAAKYPRGVNVSEEDVKSALKKARSIYENVRELI